jgi:hypothetical protein
VSARRVVVLADMPVWSVPDSPEERYVDSLSTGELRVLHRIATEGARRTGFNLLDGLGVLIGVLANHGGGDAAD